jgi:hypothetical protein
MYDELAGPHIVEDAVISTLHRRVAMNGKCRVFG